VTLLSRQSLLCDIAAVALMLAAMARDRGDSTYFSLSPL
jgi:hypothetical protein